MDQAAWLDHNERMSSGSHATSRLRHGKVLLALALAPLLSGCVAALAVPVMTAAGVFTERKHVRAATTPDLPKVEAALATPTPTVTIAPALAADQQFALTPLTDLPAPPAADPWQRFVAYALERSAARQAANFSGSALLAESSREDFLARRRPCPKREPAVLVDLDTGPAAFTPAGVIRPAPGLADGLVRLRDAGVVVMWISQLSANRVNDVAVALRSAGLDPLGTDPLLLARNAEERKQVLRDEANEDVCIVAIAGDERADFDELFDYLRNPESAVGLDAMLGSGWFLAPPPLAAVSAPQPNQ